MSICIVNDFSSDPSSPNSSQRSETPATVIDPSGLRKQRGLQARLVNFYVKLIYHSIYGFDQATKAIALDVDAEPPQKSTSDRYWYLPFGLLS